LKLSKNFSAISEASAESKEELWVRRKREFEFLQCESQDDFEVLEEPSPTTFGKF
jgi:hypothetical protein